MALSKSEPIATGECPYCGAKINYRKTHNNLVHFVCQGEYDVKQCRHREGWGRHESKAFLEKLEKEKEVQNDTAGHERKETVKEDEKPAAKTGGKPEGRRSEGGGWGATADW